MYKSERFGLLFISNSQFIKTSSMACIFRKINKIGYNSQYIVWHPFEITEFYLSWISLMNTILTDFQSAKVNITNHVI